MNNIPDIVNTGLQKYYQSLEDIYYNVFSLFQKTKKGYDSVKLGKLVYQHVLRKTKSIYIYETFTQSIEELQQSLIIRNETISREEYQSIHNFLYYHGEEESLVILDQLRVKYIPIIKQYLYLEGE